MPNLPLAFGEIVVGGIVLLAGISGQSIADVMSGKANIAPFGPTVAANSGASGAAAATGAATGGILGTSSITKGSLAGGVNPVPGAQLSRTDEGVDYTLSSKGFLAPFDSVIVNTNAGFFRPNSSGSSSIVARITSGPYTGSEYFVAEGIAPAPGIKPGVAVKAGQQIAVPVVSPYNGIVGNIEAGWWKNGLPLAQSTGGYSEGQVTAAGVLWDKLVVALGGVGRGSESIQRGSTSGVASSAL